MVVSGEELVKGLHNRHEKIGKGYYEYKLNVYDHSMHPVVAGIVIK